MLSVENYQYLNITARQLLLYHLSVNKPVKEGTSFKQSNFLWTHNSTFFFSNLNLLPGVSRSVQGCVFPFTLSNKMSTAVYSVHTAWCSFCRREWWVGRYRYIQYRKLIMTSIYTEQLNPSVNIGKPVRLLRKPWLDGIRSRQPISALCVASGLWFIGGCKGL